MSVLEEYWGDQQTPILDQLNAYKASGLTPEETAELAKAKAEERLIVLPVTPNNAEKADLDEYLVHITSKRRCRVCGCTDDCACNGGCWWVEGDLCSTCAEAALSAQNEEANHG